MSRDNYSDNLNRILNMLNEDEHSDLPSEEDPRQRLAKVDEVIGTYDQLLADDEKHRRKQQVLFPVLGTGLLAAAAFSLVSWLGEILFGTTPTAWTILGGVLLVLSGLFTINSLQYNPLKKLRDKLKSVHQSLLKPLKKKSNKPAHLYKSKSDRVIAGVAAGLARLMGLDVGVLRIMFVIAIPLTSGIMIPIYFLLAILLNFLPGEE